MKDALEEVPALSRSGLVNKKRCLDLLQKVLLVVRTPRISK